MLGSRVSKVSTALGGTVVLGDNLSLVEADMLAAGEMDEGGGAAPLRYRKIWRARALIGSEAYKSSSPGLDGTHMLAAGGMLEVLC